MTETDRLRLGFTGDVMLGRTVNERQQSRPPHAVWGTIRDRLTELDGLFCNLECCLSTRGTRWTRTRRPFHFRADPAWASQALQDVGTSLVTLANNHALDFETVALEDTFDTLDSAGISYAGAGETLADAWQPSLVSINDLDVALVAFTDNTPEFAVDSVSPGTAHVEINPDDDVVCRRVTSALSRAHDTNPDLLVASLHWGPNMQEYPPDQFQAFAHWLVDNGIDLLHGHSAHIFQGIELYRGVPILYDTGDFVDDYTIDRDLRNDRSFCFEVLVGSNGDIAAVELVPTEIENCAVHRARSEVAKWSRATMRQRSSPFETTFERDGPTLRVPVAAASEQQSSAKPSERSGD